MTVKRKQGRKICTLFIYTSILLLSFDLKADSDPTLPENSNQTINDDSTSQSIEEGWVEKKIAPPTQWVESIVAPFTQWMEDEIQQQPDNNIESAPSNNSSHDLISVNQAIASVLKVHTGKILRSQFKTGPPPYYKIKLLSHEGTVSIFNVHAFNGSLFSPSQKNAPIEQTKP